jgi:hypothetical protein
MPSPKHGSVLEEPVGDAPSIHESRRKLWVAKMTEKVFGYQKIPIEDGSGKQRTRAGIALRSTRRCRTGRFHGATW